MKSSIVTVLVWLAFAASAVAQGAPAAKPKLSEVRSLANELEGRTDKLRNLMEEYRSLVMQRPQTGGASPEAKKASEAQLARWESALDRLMRRIKAGHAAVVEISKRLDPAIKSNLPTSLAKHAADAHNEAEAVRAAAEQALAKYKPAPPQKHKPTKPAPAHREAPPLNLDDPNL